MPLPCSGTVSQLLFQISAALGRIWAVACQEWKFCISWWWFHGTSERFQFQASLLLCLRLNPELQNLGLVLLCPCCGTCNKKRGVLPAVGRTKISFSWLSLGWWGNKIPHQQQQGVSMRETAEGKRLPKLNYLSCAYITLQEPFSGVFSFFLGDLSTLWMFLSPDNLGLLFLSLGCTSLFWVAGIIPKIFARGEATLSPPARIFSLKLPRSSAWITMLVMMIKWERGCTE